MKGRDGVAVEDRVRVLRLIENMTLGRNAVGYLDRVDARRRLARRRSASRSRGQMKLEEKKQLAKTLAGIKK